MAREIIVGIDVGTHSTRVVISEYIRGKTIPRILGTGRSESKGLRHGYVTNHKEATRGVAIAIRRAEKSAGVPVKSAYISVGGVSLDAQALTGSIVLSRADNEVTQLDIDKAIQVSEDTISSNVNKKIIDTIPIKYKLDGKEVLGDPLGMNGDKIDVKTLFITCLEHHFTDLIHAVEDTGIEVEYVIASPIAASLVALSKRQRTVGCVLANIGAETVSIVVFEDDIPISLQVFSIGSTDITNDIALGLQIPLDEAEQIKIGEISTTFSRKKLDEIIDARLSDIFDLIESHLKKIGRNGLLPAGIVLTGGGVGISTIEDFAKASLRLPSTIASPNLGNSNGQKESVRDSAWFVAYGLCIFGANQARTPKRNIIIANILGKLRGWIKQLLP